jgi:SOUL heme-binding protein
MLNFLPLLWKINFGLRSTAALLTSLIFTSQTAMAIEEPSFKVIAKSGNFELRQYAPMLVAETLVDGDMDDAGSAGFRKIADYIFGNNQVQAGTSSTKIAMTAPVTMEPQSQKIAMTAPVSLIPSENMAASQQWRVHFVMPSQYTMSTIPKPKNPDVILREIPGKLFAVNSFTGFNTQSRIQAKADELSAWIGQKNLKSLSLPQLARYDPPWTLPMFRRNEVMVEVASAP